MNATRTIRALNGTVTFLALAAAVMSADPYRAPLFFVAGWCARAMLAEWNIR